MYGDFKSDAFPHAHVVAAVGAYIKQLVDSIPAVDVVITPVGNHEVVFYLISERVAVHT